MTEKDKKRLLELGQQLSTLGVEFRIAQIGLEKMVEEHGLGSPEAAEASNLCSTLALRFSQAEEEYLHLLSDLPQGVFLQPGDLGLGNADFR